MTNELVWDLCWSQVWQGALLILIVALLCRFLVKSSPKWCYWLWLVVLLKLITPPTLVSFAGIFSWIRIGVDSMLVPAHKPIEPGAAIPFKGFVATLNSISPTVLFGIWILVAILYAGLIYIRCSRFSELLRRTLTRKRPELQTLVHSIAKRMGAPNSIRVVVTSEPIGPAVLGIRRPTIVLPEAILLGKSKDQLEPILAHEIQHVKQKDSVLTVLIVMIKVVWWFNPLVWLATSRVGQFGEHVCDLEVIRFLNCDRSRYARCLVSVLESKQKFRPVLGFPGVRTSQLTADRIRTIMTVPFPSRDRIQQASAVAIAILLAAVVVPGRAPMLPPVTAPPRPDLECIGIMANADPADSEPATE